MKRPRICAVIIENNYDAVLSIEPFVDLYEVRLDLIGDGWQEWVGKLNRPWIACNRLPEEGGRWSGDETHRIAKLFEAVKLGARIVDIELRTDGVDRIVKQVKQKKAKCLVSMHNLLETPSLDELKRIVTQELATGADICKVVTTAKHFEDNLTVLRLFPLFPKVKLVALGMGQAGISSRVFSPLVGGYFTYTSIMKGQESADGQLTATYLRSFYEATPNGKN